MSSNWTKETMGECADVHLEHIEIAYFSYSKAVAWRKIGELLDHYNKMKMEVAEKYGDDESQIKIGGSL